MRLFRPDVADVDHDYVTISSYVSIVLAAIGLLGNMLCVKVMLHPELKDYSCTVFFTALALSDSVVLVYDVMDDIAVHLDDLTGYDLLYGHNEWRCRFGVFIYEFSRVVSSWLVVALAAELCLVASSVRLRPVVYSRPRAMYVALAIGLIAGAGSFPFLVISTRSEADGRCTSTYKVFFEVYMMFVFRCATQAAVPFLFIGVCIIKAVFSLGRQAAGETEDPMLSPSSQSVMPTPRPKVQARLLILAVCLTFIATVSPSTVIDTGFALKRYVSGVGALGPDWDSAWYITHAILMLNYSCKFYVVMLAWPECRAAMGGKGLGLGTDKTISGAYTMDELRATREAASSSWTMPSQFEMEERRI